MTKLLGEFLVDSGKLTREQLTNALERQVTMGGRLGTNLVEMGILSQNELTEFLGRKLGIPCAFAEDLKGIPLDVVNLIPTDLAERHHLIPFRKDRKVLSVAMRDPTDLEAVSVVSFRTGCVVKTHVASESHVQLALERYYNVPRSLRYISVPPSPAGRAREVQEPETRGEKPEERGKTDPDTLRVALERVKKDLAYATCREEVIASLMNVLSSVFDRLFFFVAKKQAISGWIGMAPGLPRDKITQLEIPSGEPSTLNDVTKSLEVFQGSLADNEGNRRFMAMVGGHFPQEALVVPLVIKNQPVAVLYGDNLHSRLPMTLAPFVKLLAEKAAMALEVLVLRQKILDQ